MKKIISVISTMILTMILLGQTINIEATSVWDVDFSYQTVTVQEGQTFDYKMMVTNNATGFTDVTFSNIYSTFSKAGFTIVGIKNGSLINSGNMTVGVNYDNVQVSGASVGAGKTGDLFVVTLKAPTNGGIKKTYSIPVYISKVAKNNYNLDVDEIAGGITVDASGNQVYTVSFNGNGGTGVPSSIQKTQGVNVIIPSTIPQRSGYTFVGWSSSSSSTKSEYNAGASYSVDKDIVLFAVWQENVTGWKQINGLWYYYGSNNQLVSGWQKIDGIWYYFSQTGVMNTEWSNIGNRWFYFGKNGAMRTGWQKVNNIWYYFNNDGGMVIGWKFINGNYYYFNTSGSMSTGWIVYSNKYYYLNMDGTMKTGWYKERETYYYLCSNGNMVIGWNEIDNKWYYFSNSGAMTTGWKKINNNWYFFTNNGDMVSGKSMLISGKSYVFNSSGVCVNPY